MTAYKCDRCGKFYTDEKRARSTELVLAEPNGHNELWQICPACTESYRRWLEPRRKKTQQKARPFETPELNGGFIFK